MAGVLLPTWILLVVLAMVVSGLPRDVDRAVIFPMAVVPNLWGIWNVLYAALRPRRISLGVFGAALPLILVPAGLALAAFLDMRFYTARHAALVLPVAMAIYYLVWKYVVSFFNRVAGLD
jgi:hypothetical protein